MIRRWEFGNKRNRCKARPQQHARVESRGAGGAQAPCGGSGGGRGGRRGPARALAQQLEGVKGASIRAGGARGRRAQLPGVLEGGRAVCEGLCA